MRRVRERAANVAGEGAERERARRLLAGLVASALAVTETEILAPHRGQADHAFARQVAIYLARTRLGLSFTEAGQLFGRDRTTAAHACRTVEERRDERGTDRIIEYLDGAVRSIAMQSPFAASPSPRRSR